MSEAPMLTLDERMKRLDIMCDVLAAKLMSEKTISKSVVREFVVFTSMAVTQYLEQKDNEKCGYAAQDNFRPEYVDPTS